MNLRDSQFIDQLFLAHYRSLLKFAVWRLGDAAAADDAVQETFNTACRKVADLRGYPDPLKWLYRTLSNHISHLFRERQRAETAENMEQHLPPYAPEQSIEEYFPREMSEVDRRIMLMFYADRYQISEIARELGLSEAAVKKRLERLRKRLKDLSEGF